MWMIKDLLPRWLRGRASALRNTRAQFRIVALAAQETRLGIVPVNNVEHYYHFLYDLVMPLWHLACKSPETVTYLVPEFGIYSPRLNEIFGERVKVVPRTEFETRVELKLPLHGYNPVHVYVTSQMLLDFREFVFQRLKIEKPPIRNKVLVIERIPPDPYFLTEARKLGAGASRRSIANHQQMLATIQSLCNEGLEVKNLQLEKMGLVEQIVAFREARVIIAQHGAGLGNCLWADSDTSVVEISNSPELDHFKIISRLLKQDYQLVRTSHAHATVNISELTDLLTANARLATIFQLS